MAAGEQSSTPSLVMLETWPRDKRGLTNFFDELNQFVLYRIINSDSQRCRFWWRFRGRFLTDSRVVNRGRIGFKL